MQKMLLIIVLVVSLSAAAQEHFIYLTADEVQIDSVLPAVGYKVPLPANHRDSLYSATIAFPEFIDMSAEDIAAYHALCADTLPTLPAVECRVVYDKKRPFLTMHLLPLVCREGKYQWLVSFMLKITSQPVATPRAARRGTEREGYAAVSRLAEGSWAKIRVSGTGVYELTSSVVSAAGFTDIDKVQIYGYGGNLQPEMIEEDYLFSTDDLMAVPQCVVNGRHLFYAKGPVSWDSNTTTTRTRNPYSDYGYYFITQGDSAVVSLDSLSFVSQYYPSADDYHSLYEVDGYAWMQGGRNLFDTTSIPVGTAHSFSLTNDTPSTVGTVYVSVTAGASSTVQVSVNDALSSTITLSAGTYDKGTRGEHTFTDVALSDINTITVRAVSGGEVRVDYISIAYDAPRAAPTLTGTHPAVEFVEKIANQNHHGDSTADMVIIIPSSQKLLAQAERLKAFHETHDSLRVSIVPANELYNEYSSGTPDANAYRRYLKMLYDRAATEDDSPKYLLLFGDGVWDNRMLTSVTSNLSPDDYLLCFESEDSYNEITCYVDDGFFCCLDNGEGSDPQRSDLLDVAVGRFPVTTATEAQIMVDKTIAYCTNDNAGAWQNTLMFLADDGNDNVHMTDVNAAADDVAKAHPAFLIKKVMWDAYEMVTIASGNTYPEVSNIIKAQQEEGALLFDYGGHGSETLISHERVLSISDFQSFSNTNLPLWITASCDIMPFDGTIETIGEAAVLNANGGAFSFFGTTRTVYSNYNKRMNNAILTYLLDSSEETSVPVGEAARRAKNYLITSSEDRTTNKLQFSLLGDPAVPLNIPRLAIDVDSINGISLADTTAINLRAGSVATIAGHVVTDEAFTGTLTAIVRDSEETITCRLNNTSSDGASSAFTYTDRTKTIFSGVDAVQEGCFTITFAVPMDINYSNESGLITLFAVRDDASLTAHGACESITLGGTEEINNDAIGPSLFCYLNDPSFLDGGTVNPTPYFVAQIYDEDGINTSGIGIGHDLMLTIDGDANKAYNLNDYFVYDFGSYTTGTTQYSIPTLSTGTHRLQFRAWDIYNNSSTTTLNFVVAEGVAPSIWDVGLTNNPATTTTTFIVSHDRQGSAMTVVLDVFDTTGRQLWQHREENTSAASTYTYTWDLTCSNGQPLSTGVYVYRVRIACDGSSYTSKAKKLVVLR